MSRRDSFLEELVAAFLEGRLSSEQSAELHEQLRSSGEARNYFLEIVNLHAALVGDAELAGATGRQAPLETAAGCGAESLSLGGGARTWAASGIAALAVCCLVVLCVRFIHLPQLEETELFATVVRLAGVEKSFSTVEGEAIHRQKVTLPQGVIELQTAKGARVVIEAPAKFIFESAQRLRVMRGRLSAEVPPAAKGFTVVTSSGDVIDLGTRFGVDVPENGAPEVHVFQGEVIARPTEAASGKSLKQGQAVAMETRRSTRRDLRDSAFIESAELEKLVSGWQDERFARSQEFFNRMQSRPSLAAAVRFHRDSPPAAAGKYRWAQGRWPGTQAVEFVERGDHLPITLAGETNELTMMAWVRLDRLPQAISSLFHGDDYFGRPGVVHWMVQEDKRQRFAISDIRSVETLLNGAPWYPESLTSLENIQGRWTHLAVVYRAADRSVRFFVNGVFDNEVHLQTAVSARLTSGRIGNWNRAERILSGRVDELVVLREALGDAEIAEAFAAGNPYP